MSFKSEKQRDRLGRYHGDPQVSLTCHQCGVEFMRRASHVRSDARRGKLHAFCSVTCSGKGRVKNYLKGPAHPQFKDGKHAYRRIALEHYGAVCQKCGYDAEASLLWVHHRDFGRTDHRLENLEVLCIRCHLEIHLEHDRAIRI